jgi:hypothetical protein
VKIRLSPIIGYAFGICAIPAGLLFLLISLPSGLLLILAGVLALPIVRKQLHQKANIDFSRWAVVGIGTVLVIASTGLLLSSVDSGPGFQQADDAWQDETRSETGFGTTANVTAELDEGEFAAWSMSPSVAVDFSYSYEVVEGGGVNVFLTDRTEFDRYRDNDDFSVYSDLSSEGERGTAKSELPAGKYILVVDNSERSTVEVSGPVTVEFTLTSEVLIKRIPRPSYQMDVRIR